MRLVLRAGFDRFSGYGNDAIDLAVNLQKAGADVLPMPTAILPGLPRSFTRLLEKDPRGEKDVLLAFCPPFDLKPWEFAGMARRSVGYTMWERTPLLPADFDGHGWDVRPKGEAGKAIHRVDEGRAFAGLDHLFVTCPMNVEAFRRVESLVPTTSVPCGIEEDDWPVARRDPSRPMTFLMVGMLAGRKNPFALLEAWRDLKRDVPEFDARLVLHTLARGLHPKIVEGAYGPDITLSMKPLDRDALIAMYHDADVMVSTSRGEGNNKPAMEFMATGGTVIATDWSGHQNWLHRDVSFPVSGSLVPAEGRLAAQEFEVDPEALKAAMLDAWHDREGTARRGDKAARWIRDTHSWSVVVERLLQELGRLG